MSDFYIISNNKYILTILNSIDRDVVEGYTTNIWKRSVGFRDIKLEIATEYNNRPRFKIDAIIKLLRYRNRVDRDGETL